MLNPQVALYMAGLTLSLIAGILVGLSLRKKKSVNPSRITLWVILVLIFSLGFNIGSNSDLLATMPGIAVYAVTIMALTVGLSVVLVAVIRRLVNLK